MIKYHINAKGEPGVCKATISECPFGGEAQHYSTKEKAQKAFENSMMSETLAKMKKAAAKPSDAFVDSFGSHFYGGDMSDRERKEVEKVLAEAIKDIDMTDPYKAADTLKVKFTEKAKEFFITDEDIDELHSVPASVYFKAILPTYGKVITAFEESFIYEGTQARDDEWTAMYDPYDLERVFFSAAAKPGALADSESLEKSFVKQAKKTGWINTKVIARTIRAASESALAEIDENRNKFVKDFNVIALNQYGL